MQQFTYALIHHQDGAYGVSFPDFPGAVSGGENAEEALRRGAQTLAFHIAGMIEDGDTLPALRNLDQLNADPVFRDDAAGAIVFMLPFETPGRSLRVNISMEERLLDQVDKAARAAGQSRSAFLADAAKARLRSAA